MNPLCTSFAFAPRRIARSRAARWLVGMLALVLATANIASAAMPIFDVTADHAVAATHMSSHMHCKDHAVSAANSHHGVDCSCCIGHACACAQACDAPAVVLVAAMTAPSTRVFATPAPRAYAAIESRPLRPPIV